MTIRSGRKIAGIFRGIVVLHTLLAVIGCGAGTAHQDGGQASGGAGGGAGAGRAGATGALGGGGGQGGAGPVSGGGAAAEGGALGDVAGGDGNAGAHAGAGGTRAGAGGGGSGGAGGAGGLAGNSGAAGVCLDGANLLPAGVDCGTCRQCDSTGACVAGYEGIPDPTGCNAPQSCSASIKMTAQHCSAGVCVSAATSCPLGCAGNDCEPSVCGNNLLEPGEQCDDGNTETERCPCGVSACTVCDFYCHLVAGAVSACDGGP
jgi:hypothetical protein